MVKVGDVVRVQINESGRSDFRNDAVWCVIRDDDGGGDMPESDVLLGEAALERESWDGDGRLTLALTLDVIEVVPESEWPDEVCAAMAKRALLSEANK